MKHSHKLDDAMDTECAAHANVRRNNNEPLVVAVMWPRLGPYHVARLTAAHASPSAHGSAVVALTVSDEGGTYTWTPSRACATFEQRVLFPGADYRQIPPAVLVAHLTRELDLLRPDVVAVCGWVLPESHAALRWCRRNGRAAILMSDSNESDYRRVWWKDYLKGRIVDLCDAALVAAEPQADYVVRLGMPRPNIFFGYDVIDNHHFARQADMARQNATELRRRLNLEFPFILTVARFIPEKNLLSAMRAYAQYVSRHGPSAWNWVLCGAGPLQSEILALREKLYLQHYMQLPGFVQYDQLPVYYGLSHGFWLPSIKDTWGLIVNEAMSSGLPVFISHKLGCASTLVEEGRNGWTFDPGSVEEMTEMLCRMHELPEEKRATMGRRSREIIAAWGPERFAEGFWKAVRAAVRHAQARRPGLSWMDRALLCR